MTLVLHHLKAALFLFVYKKFLKKLNLYFQVQIKVLNTLMIRNIQRRSMISIITKIMFKVIQLNKIMNMNMINYIIVPTLMILNNKNTSTNAYND